MLASLYAAVARATTADWLLLLSGVLLLLYVVGTWRHDIFKRRGFASARHKMPFLGNTYKGFFNISSFPDLMKNLYREGHGHSVFGVFQFQQPQFMIRNPTILKAILVKNFDSFLNRVKFTNERGDPIFSQTLFFRSDQQWKDMRTTLSPAFTSSKIKTMFFIISECTSQTAQHLHQKHKTLIEKGKHQTLEVDMKDLFTRLANDVIATVAFGVNCDSQKESQNEFYLMGKEITTFSFWRILGFIINLAIPKLAEVMGIRLMGNRAIHFFDSLVHGTIRERQQKGIFRPDMLQLLMQAREGQLKAEASEEHETEKYDTKFKLSDNDISGQAVGFYFAGFETVSTALCFTAHALSRHPEVQERLQREVDEVMRATGGKPTYEAIQGMKYLEAVVNESLRLYPPVQVVNRTCREDIVLAPTDTSDSIRFLKDDVVLIPIYGLHSDPEYWPDPEKFDPERFSDENKHNIKPFTYMPFGAGPRFCIAQRLALLEIKLTLVSLMADFHIRPSLKTAEPVQFEKGVTVSIRGGFWNVFIPRK